MVSDPRTGPHARQPQIENARLAQTGEHARYVDCQRCQQNLERAENQKQLDREDRVQNEERIGDPGEHLRARQRGEQRLAAQIRHGSPVRP